MRLADWLIEEGIGEHRAILVEGDRILAARLDWPGALTSGQVEDAQLIARAAGSTRGTARFANGEEALVDHLPPAASEGAKLRLKITRAAIAEAGRLKRAQSRPSEDAPRPAPTLAENLRAQGHPVRIVRRFPALGRSVSDGSVSDWPASDWPASDWEELVADAFAREIAFDGGSLLLAPTPAMTLVDIDGVLDPKSLALAAVAAIAATLRRLDIGGSIGIDFPTLPAKADRRAVDVALDAALAGWPHERTAMNGFGFVQLVARLERPSILQRVTSSRVSAAARLLLRRGEGVAEPGAILLTAHPALRARVKPEWEVELARRTGREIRWHSDPALAPEAGFAQAVPL